MKKNKETLGNLTDLVRQALLVGGEVLKKGFSKRRRVSFKTKVSPVTQVDLESERRIISLIRKKFPDHKFLAEESSFFQKTNLKAYQPGQYRWVIDPLDGTINYIHYVPHACVSVAVEKDGVVLAGGVFDPFRQELFLATKGKGARLNGRRIRVTNQNLMRHSLLITGFPYDRDKKALKYLRLLEPFLRKSQGIRRYGAAAIDFAWVACGRAEGYWESNLCPWDVAAGALLVEEAGGKVTDFQGGPYSFAKPAQTLATNARLHPQFVRLFKQANHK